MDEFKEQAEKRSGGQRENGLIGFYRGEMCPFCTKAYPTHKPDCESDPTHCEDCGHHTSHCENGHCQECYIDDEHYPIEDCDACSLLVGSLLRATRDDGEALPHQDEIHDLIPTPFED